MSEGIAAALGEVLEGTATGQQLVDAGLFDGLDVAETGSLVAPSPLSSAHPLADAIRKRGRPPGSRNRRTEATVRWLLSQHRHPVSVMMEAYSMSPAQLAVRIGLKPGRWVEDSEGRPGHWEGEEYTNDVLLELFKLQVRMAEACGPYVAQRLPQAVTVEGAVDFTMQFAGVSLPAQGGAAENPDVVEGAFNVVLPGEVGRDQSDDGAK